MYDRIVAPSGRIFAKRDQEFLALACAYGFIEWRDTPFKLKSGIFSNVYVFGREDVTDHPDLEWLIGQIIVEVVLGCWRYTTLFQMQPCMIGIPTAGTALAQAAAMVAWAEKEKHLGAQIICHRIMREALKQSHGAGTHKGTWVNGKPNPRQWYWGWDNVATNGDSKFEAAEKWAADGYNVGEMIAGIFVDRQQGAVPRLEKAGLFKKIVTVFNLLDITFAFGELGLWPKNAVKAVEKEIADHQFLA